MDIIYLHGIRCECRIGVWEWEKQVDQTLMFDIDIAADTRKAAMNDELKDALDYQAVAERVKTFASENQFDLIETLAERLSAVLLEEFALFWLRIKVDKGQAVAGVKNVGLIIERGGKA